MRQGFIATVLIASFCFSASALADQTIVYPDKAHPAFSIVAPDDWKLDEADEAGGFFDLNGPTGALVSMRTVTATGEDVAAAMKDTMAFIGKSYADVKTEKMDSPEGTYVAGGTGKDKKDGHEVKFMMLWSAINDDTVIEIWAAIDDGDKAGGQQAKKILNSVKPRS